MDDLTLRCNSLKCRAPLLERAVVTTCSHIFCTECANASGLSTAVDGAGAPVCPACHTQLNNPDDAVLTCLNPADDYRTSVLSGLSPTIIMECAARGLAFWNYQTGQEIKYQTYLGQTLAERYQSLSDQTDRIVQEANNELGKLHEQVQGFQNDQSGLIHKNKELHNEMQEKNRKILQLKKMYQVLKDKEMSAQVQGAAEDNADYTLLAATDYHSDRLSAGRGALASPIMSRLPTNRQGGEQVHSRQRSGTSASFLGASSRFRGGLHAPNSGMAPPRQTPSQYRTRLPLPQRAAAPLYPSSTTRQPLRPIVPNGTALFNNSQLHRKASNLSGHQTPLFGRATASGSADFL